MPDISEQILTALRRVTRAVDRYSRQLAQNHGLTGPQALVMREAQRNPGIGMGELSKRISLSQATVTDIVKRLETRGLLMRQRDGQDKRRVTLRLTEQGAALMTSPLPLLQEEFVAQLHGLEEWEQSQLLSSLQRIARMMHAEDIDAAPVLASGGVTATPEAVVQVTGPVPAVSDGPAGGQTPEGGRLSSGD